MKRDRKRRRQSILILIHAYTHLVGHIHIHTQRQITVSYVSEDGQRVDSEIGVRTPEREKYEEKCSGAERAGIG